jgi:ubiquinone/menaquinone biosynthesis C-methylase UbiE
MQLKTEPADIFDDIRAHMESGRFIRNNSSNRQDIRDFTFNDVDLGHCRDVLDLGCAYGFFTRGLAGRLHPEAVINGIDLCRECEEYFITSCEESGYSCRFCLSDEVFCERYGDNSFDLVLCTYALYFFPQAVPEIARILRPTGIFTTVTHTVPHMPEIIAIFKLLLTRRLGRPVTSLPLESLFTAFSSANGRQVLSPWFLEINEKKYTNSLLINTAALPGLIRYLCFKTKLFLPGDCGLDDRFIRTVVAEYLHDLLRRRQRFSITKNDTVYVCLHPASGRTGKE